MGFDEFLKEKREEILRIAHHFAIVLKGHYPTQK